MIILNPNFFSIENSNCQNSENDNSKSQILKIIILKSQFLFYIDFFLLYWEEIGREGVEGLEKQGGK
jgi:hypothetical protein